MRSRSWSVDKLVPASEDLSSLSRTSNLSIRNRTFEGCNAGQRIFPLKAPKHPGRSFLHNHDRTWAHKRTDRQLTSIHSPQHTCDELVDTPTFFDKRYKGRDTAFVVSGVIEMREHHFLKWFNLILKTHQVGDGFVSLSNQKSVVKTNSLHTPH
jgi:hypothetical protein